MLAPWFLRHADLPRVIAAPGHIVRFVLVPADRPATSCQRHFASERLAPRALGSDVDPLGDAESVHQLDAEVARRAVDLGVPERELHGKQMARLPVDQRRLRPSPRVGSSAGGVTLRCAHAILHQPHSLPCRVLRRALKPAWKERGATAHAGSRSTPATSGVAVGSRCSRFGSE